MKLQDVLLRAMAKKIIWWTTAEIIGVSDRTMRRWRNGWRQKAIRVWRTGATAKSADGGFR
jgi:hypothetical protein